MTRAQVRFGEFFFDGLQRRLARNSENVRLAPKAFELLNVLIEERPRAVPKRVDGRCVLEDLGSTNGTWRKERFASPVDLCDGDRLRIGGVALIFRSTPRAETTAALD